MKASAGLSTEAAIWAWACSLPRWAVAGLEASRYFGAVHYTRSVLALSAEKLMSYKCKGSKLGVPLRGGKTERHFITTACHTTHSHNKYTVTAATGCAEVVCLQRRWTKKTVITLFVAQMFLSSFKEKEKPAQICRAEPDNTEIHRSNSCFHTFTPHGTFLAQELQQHLVLATPIA